jgi:hypothetical protein
MEADRPARSDQGPAHIIRDEGQGPDNQPAAVLSIDTLISNHVVSHGSFKPKATAHKTCVMYTRTDAALVRTRIVTGPCWGDPEVK